ncbi:hypothetical protein MGSAQ_002643 [marine sediment metagenome]|uniref:Uncharacterized protein n=1 Tax=marine sediment metagenome TaxID=412755 RepID=A0A1B6NRE5_9ZZZZ
MSRSSWMATGGGPPNGAGRVWSATVAGPSGSSRSSAPAPTWGWTG